MLPQNDVESYRREGYLPGRRLLSAAEAERFRNDCQGHTTRSVGVPRISATVPVGA